MKRAALTVLLCLPDLTSALEARDTQGLEVRLEAIAEPIEVDGLPLVVRRASGPDVTRLAQRVTERWRRAGSPLRELRHGQWQMVSRWQGTQTQLLQWRGEGDDAELLYSSFDAHRRPLAVGRPSLELPAGCTWGRQIQGRAGRSHYQQRTALCRTSAQALLPQLRQRFTLTGWTWREPSAGLFDLARAGSKGMVVLMPGRSHAESGLVWITDQPVGTAGP